MHLNKCMPTAHFDHLIIDQGDKGRSKATGTTHTQYNNQCQLQGSTWPNWSSPAPWTMPALVSARIWFAPAAMAATSGTGSRSKVAQAKLVVLQADMMQHRARSCVNARGPFAALACSRFAPLMSAMGAMSSSSGSDMPQYATLPLFSSAKDIEPAAAMALAPPTPPGNRNAGGDACPAKSSPLGSGSQCSHNGDGTHRNSRSHSSVFSSCFQAHERAS
jgi:hypothetical protein